MRSALGAGIDPAARRRAVKSSRGDTFEAVAREWFKSFSRDWADSHLEKVIRRLELYLFPWIGARLAKLETAKRALQNCRRIFRYAIATARAESNPSL
jgi:integrase